MLGLKNGLGDAWWGGLGESGEVESLRAQLRLLRIPVRVVHVGESMCLLSFLVTQAWAKWIIGYTVRFKGWLVDAQPWGVLDLAKENRFRFRFTKVPLFLWHKAFFKSLGLELGELLEVADKTKSRRDLSNI